MKYPFLIAALLLATACLAQTPRITFQAPKMYPEGLACNSKTNTFYTSSVKTGTIGTVNSAGVYKVFYENKDLKSSYGMKIDPATNRLWVCTGDANYSEYADSATYKKMIRLIALDLNSGKKVQDIDLSGLYPGKHFANDLALDGQGNIYVTDSYSPVIYKVDAQGKATVFAENDLFKGKEVALNGIACNPQGFLLVNNGSTGTLLKVDIANPENVSVVSIQNLFPGADGMLWDAAGNLVLVQNKGVDKVYQIASTDGWQSAKIKAATSVTDRFQNPTTGVVQGGKLYALNAKLNELNDPTKKPSDEFSLQEVVWKPM